jgi:hypothetical protein
VCEIGYVDPRFLDIVPVVSGQIHDPAFIPGEREHLPILQVAGGGGRCGRSGEVKILYRRGLELRPLCRPVQSVPMSTALPRLIV